MTGANQLRAALARKNGTDTKPARVPVPIPDPIVFITAGPHIASDGKPYVITYENVELVEA